MHRRWTIRITDRSHRSAMTACLGEWKHTLSWRHPQPSPVPFALSRVAVLTTGWFPMLLGPMLSCAFCAVHLGSKRKPPFDLCSGSERVSSFCVEFLAHFSFSYWMLDVKQIKTKNENSENRRTARYHVVGSSCFSWSHPQLRRSTLFLVGYYLHTVLVLYLFSGTTPDEPGRILHTCCRIGASEGAESNQRDFP
jgi:hypothetical protein